MALYIHFQANIPCLPNTALDTRGIKKTWFNFTSFFLSSNRICYRISYNSVKVVNYLQKNSLNSSKQGHQSREK
jgi:hypothetical protein